MSLSDEEAATFGFFPTIQWSPGTHVLFPAMVKAQVKTLLLMTHKRPNGAPKHPECPLAELPDTFIMSVLEYVAGSVPVQSSFETSTEVPHYQATAFDDIKLRKPKAVNGIILEFGLGLLVPDSLEYLRSEPGTGMTINGLSTLVYPEFYWNCCDVFGAYSMPKGVKSTGWDMSHKYDMDMWFNPVPSRGKLHQWRVVLRPLGENVVLIRSADATDEHVFEHTWSNDVQDHGACDGMRITRQGPCQLPCKMVHELFHSDELVLRPFATPAQVEAIVGDVKIMLF